MTGKSHPCLPVLLTLAASLATGACGIATGPRLAQSAQSPGKIPSVQLDPKPEGQPNSPLGDRFTDALKSAFAGSGVAVVGESSRHLSVAFVQRPASLGITQRKDGVPAENDWLSVPRRHNWYDKCRAQRFEATLVLTDAKQADPPLVARGEFDACSADDARLQTLARTLVKNLLAG